ncbi:MAG: aldo/keto reductase, partial [Bacteroidales bacterium]|nr:aldo/keto reductase [Bacteroidales bacterium]
IVRVPLASGLLSGKYTADTSFGKDDHRTFNRRGEAFDKGETFSGVDYARGLEAVEEIKKLFPAGQALSALALRWILMFSQVSTVIPGASRPEQVLANVQATNLPTLTEEQMQGIRRIYRDRIWPLIANEAW